MVTGLVRVTVPGSNTFLRRACVALTAILLAGTLASTLVHAQLAAVLMSKVSSWLPKEAHKAADGDEAGVAHVKVVCWMALLTVLVTTQTRMDAQ